MSIRFKKVKEIYQSCVSWPQASCIDIIREYDVPIRDWSANPSQVTAPNYTIGAAAPASAFVLIIFPELTEINDQFSKFRYKIKKNVPGVDFVKISGDKLTGNVFDGFNLDNRTIEISYQNMDNLFVGLHEINLVIEAYGVNDNGSEVYVESSTDQNVSIPIRVTVLSGNGFNTDKNSYNITYNKADGSLSGDQRIIVYSAEAVTANSPDAFISLVQTSSSTERFLTFQRNTDLQNKAVGNYPSKVNITKGNQSKTVNVILDVVNDATQFYVSPTVFNTTIQKNLSETKTLEALISNPNNLSIVVDLKPSFIESAVISNDKLIIVTQNSADLALGNYSGDIILKSGTVTKKVTVNLSVMQAITHDFTGLPYYFALDKRKVVVNKTNPGAAYVKMDLSMFFKGFGKEHLENQTYTFPFFKGSAEIYPGDEIQDFFIKAKDMLSSLDPLDLYNLALVTMTFHEMSATDEIISTFSLDNINFAPGKRPRCFPIFTDHPIRSTYDNSVIKVNVDQLTDKAELTAFYNIYNLPKPPFVSKPAVHQLTFLRSKFHDDFKTKIIANNVLQLIPLPNVDNIIHIEWENQNLVFDWFSAVDKTKEIIDIENIIGESRDYQEEKFDNKYTRVLTVNTGWLLLEEIDLITDIMLSRLCFIHTKSKRFKAFPIGRKNELKDSENSKFSMDLEFKILIEK